MAKKSISILKDEVTPWIRNVGYREKELKNALVNDIGTKSQKELVSVAESNSVSNKAANSIGSKLKDFGVGLSVEIFARASYFNIAFETGRKPGKMPPIKALERWADRVGVPAFAVAKSIAQRGTKRFREGGPKLVTGWAKKTDKIVDKARPNILKILTR